MRGYSTQKTAQSVSDTNRNRIFIYWRLDEPWYPIWYSPRGIDKFGFDGASWVISKRVNINFAERHRCDLHRFLVVLKREVALSKTNCWFSYFHRIRISMIAFYCRFLCAELRRRAQDEIIHQLRESTFISCQYLHFRIQSSSRVRKTESAHCIDYGTTKGPHDHTDFHTTGHTLHAIANIWKIPRLMPTLSPSVARR